MPCEHQQPSNPRTSIGLLTLLSPGCSPTATVPPTCRAANATLESEQPAGRPALKSDDHQSKVSAGQCSCTCYAPGVRVSLLHRPGWAPRAAEQLQPSSSWQRTPAWQPSLDHLALGCRICRLYTGSQSMTACRAAH